MATPAPAPALVAHTTTNEIKFLNELGTFTRITDTKKTLLEGYLVGAMRRSDWGSMDRAEVIAHAKKLHANER